MTDRLAEIEAALAVAEQDRSRPTVSRADLRDLLAVAKAARALCDARDECIDSGPGVIKVIAADNHLHAALANLGGAT